MLASRVETEFNSICESYDEVLEGGFGFIVRDFKSNHTVMPMNIGIPQDSLAAKHLCVT